MFLLTLSCSLISSVKTDNTLVFWTLASCFSSFDTSVDVWNKLLNDFFSFFSASISAFALLSSDLNALTSTQMVVKNSPRFFFNSGCQDEGKHFFIFSTPLGILRLTLPLDQLQIKI
ncbi:hypothetical protein BpHYR1_040126 [Brachionus plicatilis]|uniref:Uncharacterized protein n=1 Tax=Brachionus plicatilis TaxID=10195 RepID=A0A3M7RC20_BRAPC|nr:hypothetical protein BpHYR1_040126 [Brachionus plicatilis]